MKKAPIGARISREHVDDFLCSPSEICLIFLEIIPAACLNLCPTKISAMSTTTQIFWSIGSTQFFALIFMGHLFTIFSTLQYFLTNSFYKFLFLQSCVQIALNYSENMSLAIYELFSICDTIF